MEILITTAAGFALDLLLGDPERVPHPVVYMGRVISALEKMLRRLFPKTDKGELAAGAVLAVVMSAGTLTLTALACFVLGKIHPALPRHGAGGRPAGQSAARHDAGGDDRPVERGEGTFLMRYNIVLG